MKYPWRYFNVTFAPQESAKTIKLLVPTGVFSYSDDYISYPTSHHGADDRRDKNENTATSAKRKNLRGTVSKFFNTSQDAGRPQKSAIDPVIESPVSAAKKRKLDELTAGEKRVRGTRNPVPNTQETRTLEGGTRDKPIKAAAAVIESSVQICKSTNANAMHHVYGEYRSPARRWLAGAPGGWWPSDQDASSDEEIADSSPRRSYHLDDDGRQTPCALASYGSVDDDEPQSSPLRHGPRAPEVASPILPHGSRSYSSNEDSDAVILERSFGSLSTLALASDSEREAQYAPTKGASSSSGYGSAAEDDERTSRDESPHPSQQHEGRDNSPPTIARRRRTRAERAARNAAWARSVTAEPAIEVIDLTQDSDYSDSSSSTYHLDDMDWEKYRVLCKVFERTKEPEDGKALLKVVREEITRGFGRRRAQNWRDNMKRQLILQARQEAEEAVRFMDEMAGQPAPMPGTSKGKGAKRKESSTPSLAKRQAIGAIPQTAEEQALSVQPANLGAAPASIEHRAGNEMDRPMAASTPCTFALERAGLIGAPIADASNADRMIAAASNSIAPATTTSENGGNSVPSESGSDTTDHAAHAVVASTSSGLAPPVQNMQAIMWLASPAAFLTRQTMDLDLSSLFSYMPPMASPAAAIRASASAAPSADMPPLTLEELDDEINASLGIPPTPATPAHLRDEQSNWNEDGREHRVEMLPLTTSASIRMRIVRNDGPSSTTTNDDSS
ncbi:hypothetical protein QAD02_014638 [Eretmocerus hayati]|uniref:Uncharacterized protein n=1 Tax=Eretmocerus hayati TaxID=131215 RepID=A0ACC2P7K1_9HYME|nr:hypothetical protein QAD02_014638 [Eretmocerus hayati]